MICPLCQSDTRVVDSRLQDGNVIRRRRECEAGHRFTTWEGTVNVASLIESRRKAVRTWKAKQGDEKLQAMNKRYHTRRAARQEARDRGIPPEQLYREWGVE